MPTISRLLVPVDFSACSRAALEYALFLGERFGASIDVLHVWDRPHGIGPEFLIAGVWMIGNRADIWMPTSSRMVAVEHSWVEGAWLRGTQVQHWLRMLVEDVPDVAGAVLRAFPTL
jgi:nucleotide-binding universal stress UspA family protein